MAFSRSGFVVVGVECDEVEQLLQSWLNVGSKP
jgi:hypothetical protein